MHGLKLNLTVIPSACLKLTNRRVTKFVADVMLGRLARFMRFSGYDVEYDSFAGDDALLHRSRYRILLTRDRELARRAANYNVYFVQATGAERQIEEIKQQFPLKDPHTRCLKCNRVIRKVSKRRVQHLIPPYIYQRHQEFYRCSRCGKVYWKGSHYEHLERMLQFRPRSGEQGPDRSKE